MVRGYEPDKAARPRRNEGEPDLVAKAAALIAGVVVFAVVGAGSASAHATGIGFTSIPRHVVQGKDANVSVSVRPAGARCTLGVRYQGGATQPGLRAVAAARGHAGWTWQVPADVQAGPAVATVRCAGAGSRSHQLVIVGRLVEPKITVLKQGFSIRPNPTTGTRLSYGLVLHNDSTSKDASGVNVQVNFVMGDNNLLGTDTQRISVIPAGGDFAVGHQISFPQAAPIVRLEVVIQVDTYVAPSTRNPTLANMHLEPQLFDQNWLGTVEGELQNTDPAQTLQFAVFSAVIFDSAGNIIGGGSGMAFSPLPPGAREFIQLNSGFDTIPMEEASSAMVSVTTTWKPPGA
jgi:hypothetical protein